MRFIGIDPGKTGGICWIDEHGPHAMKMPTTRREQFRTLAELEDVDTVAVIERVHSMPNDGKSRAWAFGVHFGGLLMALEAAGIIYSDVTPAKWQRHLDCLTGGNKNVTKKRAQELFPTIKCTHAISDALLLAEYCRQTSGANNAR
tara:strand:+ start:400 stop:837 length:438 start_codon:yes stop_codon:yes gene_type:complete